MRTIFLVFLWSVCLIVGFVCAVFLGMFLVVPSLCLILVYPSQLEYYLVLLLATSFLMFGFALLLFPERVDTFCERKKKCRILKFPFPWSIFLSATGITCMLPLALSGALKNLIVAYTNDLSLFFLGFLLVSISVLFIHIEEKSLNSISDQLRSVH